MKRNIFIFSYILYPFLALLFTTYINIQSFFSRFDVIEVTIGTFIIVFIFVLFYLLTYFNRFYDSQIRIVSIVLLVIYIIISYDVRVNFFLFNRLYMIPIIAFYLGNFIITYFNKKTWYLKSNLLLYYYQYYNSHSIFLKWENIYESSW